VDGDGVRFSFNLRFPGQYYDVETKLHYNYFRDYNPATGRYVQSDPIALSGGLNTYDYVQAAPIGIIDPLGLDGQTAANWAKIMQSVVNDGMYQFWDPHSESRGRLTELLDGRGAPKCNVFVWDALSNGGNPPPLIDGRIPTTADWISGKVQGYHRLPVIEKPKYGDVIVLDGHMGLYAPLPDGSPGTISAATNTDPRQLPNFFEMNKLLHNNWGFREGQQPAIYRCDCDAR
jgi:RHS repeat-associated protein